MEDKYLLIEWEILALLLSLGALTVSYRDYKKGWLNIWAVIGSALITAWSAGQWLSWYLVFENLKFINLGIFAAAFLGSFINAGKKQSLTYPGLTVASLALFGGELLNLFSANPYILWLGRLSQLVSLGFWFTFLLLPKIENKFRKEEQKLQASIGEKENLLQKSYLETEAGKKQLAKAEEISLSTQERANKLSIFPQIAKNMGSSTDRELILQSIPEEIVRIWKVQTCGLYLWDAELGILVLRFGAGYDGYLLNRLSFKNGEGLVGWVAVEGKPVRLEDPERDVRFKDKYNQLAKAKKIAFKATLVAPVNVGDKNLGVIELVNYSGWKGQPSTLVFSEDDENMLFTLANQVALFLQSIGQYEEGKEAYLDIIRSLVNAIEARDPYTRGHSEQTTKYAVAIAQKLNLPQEAVEIIRYAASLHDIGKIGIKETILKKSKKLTADEYSHIKNHPFMGAQILKPIKSLQEVIPIVYHHHERYDGQGYLDGLQKEEIPIGARILSVADSFEAMTSDRPYHKGLPKQEAMIQLKESMGSQFDPQVVNAFLEVLEEETLNTVQTGR